MFRTTLPNKKPLRIDFQCHLITKLIMVNLVETFFYEHLKYKFFKDLIQIEIWFLYFIFVQCCSIGCCLPCLFYIFLAYNDASNRSAHEKKKHGGLYQAGSCTEIKEDCES